MKYQPKGGMCAVCQHKLRDCSKLPFYSMKVFESGIDVKIVICSHFKRGEAS